MSVKHNQDNKNNNHGTATDRLESFNNIIEKMTVEKPHSRSSSQSNRQVELNFRRNGGKPTATAITVRSGKEGSTLSSRLHDNILSDVKNIFDEHYKKNRFKENKQEMEVLQIQKDRTEIDEILKGLENRDKTELYLKEKESKALSDEVSKMFLKSKPELERKEMDRINQIKEIHQLQKEQEDLENSIKEGI